MVIVQTSKYDALIIGGSHAGLSAAMAIGRLKRTALVVDAGAARNSPAEHAYNIAGSDGINPIEIRGQARLDLKKYNTIDLLSDSVLKVTKKSEMFEANLQSGKTVTSRKILLAYGVKDVLPPITGIEELWGKSVFHCPYCHGFEVSDRTVGIMSNGKAAEHLLPLMLNLTENLVLFTNGKPDLSDTFRGKLEAHGISIVEDKPTKLEVRDGKLRELKLDNNKSIKIDAFLVSPSMPFQFNGNLANEFACEKDQMGFIKVDEMGATSVAGVYAAGDIVTMMHSVVSAGATGQAAGAGVVSALSLEDF